MYLIFVHRKCWLNKYLQIFALFSTLILIFSGTTLDQQYCSKTHSCHYSLFTMCPGIKHHQAEHNECQNYVDLEKKHFFKCLDRSDIGPAMFQQTIFRKGTAELPNLSTFLHFDNSGFHGTEDIFVGWTYEELRRLWNGDRKECTLKNSKTIEETVLFQLLVTDLSFKGKHLIPQRLINSFK